MKSMSHAVRIAVCSLLSISAVSGVGMVVCYGSDGHIGIEFIHTRPCDSSSRRPQQCDGHGNLATFSSDANAKGWCVDVPLVTDRLTYDAAKTRQLLSSKEAGHPIASPSWLADTRSISPLIGGHKPQDLPYTWPHLLAQGTIVLRI